MLTPKQLQSLPKPLTDIYSELSDFLLQDIALRISKAAKITDTAEYQMYRARALGMSTDAIKKEIARINGVAEEKIAELIAQVAEQSDEFDRKMLGASGGVPLAENTQLQKLMAAQIEQTRGLCTNLTGTLGFAQRTADGRMIYGSATDFLRKQMDMAQMKVMTGVCDYNTAVRQACFALADSGLRTIYYASGHSDRIEVAVRRALMTSVSQLTQKISEQNAAEFGADGWEISAHIGARPSHAVYQGRQYPNSQYETIVLPLITDYNCRHSAYPIILGVTKPSYTKEQLQALDPPPFTYEGRRYTAYEAQQQMRKMERAMRRQKDRCVVADAVGDKDAFTAASIKLRRQKDYYENFCKAAGTYTEYERTFVAGYNRQLAAKTGAVTRKQNAFKNAQITLTNSGNGGIIKPKVDFIKDYADIDKALMEKVGFDMIEPSFASIDPKLAITNVNQLIKLEQKFGVIHKSTGSICAINSGTSTVAYTSVKITCPSSQNLSLCPKFYRNKKDHRKTAILDRNCKHAMPFAEKYADVYTVTHEYGHMLQNLLVEEEMIAKGWLKSTPRMFVKNAGTKKQRLKWYTDIFDDVEKKCFDEIIEIAKQRDKNFSYNKCISRYGNSSKAEFFAEVFANAQTGNPNALGKAMNIWLKRKGLIE
ncbi:MAG: hypothetical protein K2N38_07400 [Oscillospiraceae bacterium]|nr:hypothetical protein [Oscillospiraceae bacterium]